MFLKNPNLPKGEAKCVAISEDTSMTVFNELESLNVKCIKVRKYGKLSSPVSSHSDMLIHHLSDNRILLALNQPELLKSLTNIGFSAEYINEELSDKYPYDCLLNAARIGNILFTGKFISSTIKEYCELFNIIIYTVKQGYTKCSITVLNENAIITADKGIHNKAISVGLDSLLINEGEIEIDKYNYGFIGGCCGKISNNILAFNGDIKRHSSYNNIKAFANNYGIDIIDLNSGSLIDIGGIIPLIEEDDEWMP